MGGFLGIGTSSEAKELDRQNQLKRAEAETARRDAEIRLAEKRAKKGQETANIKLGTNKRVTEVEGDKQVGKTAATVSGTLAIGSKPTKRTGVQV